MKKENIEVILTSNGQISEGKYLAIKDEDHISYLDNDVKVCLYFKNGMKMTRENDEYLLDLNFIIDKTTKGKYFLKNMDKTIDLYIATDYIIVEPNLMIIKYKVLTTDQEVIFKLKM